MNGYGKTNTFPHLTMEEYEAQVARLEQQVAELSAKLKARRTVPLGAKKKRFGALSEKTDPNQAVNEWFDIKRRIERIVQQ